MARLLEYLNHHPYLAGGAFIVAIIALVYELRTRALGATGISNNEAIGLHNKGALVLDVRNAEEFATGHIVNAKNISLETLDANLDSIKKYREKPVIVVCEAGSRSAQAVKQLKAHGYTSVFSLSGGLAGWRTDNLPLSKPASNKKLEKAS